MEDMSTGENIEDKNTAVVNNFKPIPDWDKTLLDLTCLTLRVKAHRDNIKHSDNIHSNIEWKMDYLFATYDIDIPDIVLMELHNIPGILFYPSMDENTTFAIIEDSGLSHTLFKKGICVCYGVATEESAKKSCKNVVKLLNDAGVLCSVKRFTIQQMVVSAKLANEIDIDSFAKNNTNSLFYHISSRYGVEYHVPGSQVYIFISQNGEVIIKGCNNYGQISRALSRVHDMMKDYYNVTNNTLKY